MSKTNKSTLKVSKNEPTLWDLISQYFPPKYAEIYSDPEIVKKVVDATIEVKLPPGCKIEPYRDRNAVHAAALKLHKKNRDMKAPQLAEQPEIMKIIGAEEEKYTFETAVKWIRQLKLHNKPGPSKKITK
jgi:hypothetical protein